MSDYPRMLYFWPSTGAGPAYLQDGIYDCLIVDSAAEHEAASGWHLTPADARNAGEAAQKAADDTRLASAEYTPPDPAASREDLASTANELGIKFDGRTSDNKLLGLITRKLDELSKNGRQLEAIGG